MDLSPHRSRIDQMRRTVSDTAGELGIPAELLATRKTIERLARRVLSGREPPLSHELSGWRQDVIGERLLQVLAQSE